VADARETALVITSKVTAITNGAALKAAPFGKHQIPVRLRLAVTATKQVLA
jgi:hypothetical protein